MRPRNSVISSYFSEESYKGQDIVNYGARIPLHKCAADELIAKFDKSARQRISKPDQNIQFFELRQEHLFWLRQMWFDPNDPTFPNEIGDHTGIVAVKFIESNIDCSDLDGNYFITHTQVIGGVIWAPSGPGLFMHQLVAGQEGKDLNVPTLLIAESVRKYNTDEFKQYAWLDVGVSYNPKRQDFFQQFAVEKYPIILKKPHNVPVIRLTPFRGFENKREINVPVDLPLSFKDCVTFFPRASYALYGCLKYLDLNQDDTVLIVKTFGSKLISGCVTKQIERVCKWKLYGHDEFLDKDVKAVLIINEFGLIMKQFNDVVKKFKDLNIPVIEDSAWMIGRDRLRNSLADFTIYSCQKTLGINYGGILHGVDLDDDFMWSIGCLDTFKRTKFFNEEDFSLSTVNINKRINLWRYYDSLVRGDCMTPDNCYDYAGAIERGEWMPTVYLQRFKDDAEADAIVERLEDFGIEAGRYWGEPIVYLPIHQNMTEAEVEYMFAVVRGYFNLCRDWKGK